MSVLGKRYGREIDEEDEVAKFMKQYGVADDGEVEVDGKCSDGNGSSAKTPGDEGYISIKQRKLMEQERLRARKAGQNGQAQPAEQENGASVDAIKKKQQGVSLLEQAAALRKAQAALDEAQRKQQEQQRSEMALLKEANQVQTNALQSNEEIATGVRRTEALTTTWRPPKYLLDKPESYNEEMRKKWHIIVEGEDCPPPVKTFKEMKLPQCLLDALQKKGIQRPTPIQVQGIPALLAGRDIVGIAFTGSGKTLTFSLPMIMFALEEEMNMPLEGGEGPIGLILCPSRELARQTYEVVEYFIKALVDAGYPELRSALVIGGESNQELVDTVKRRGVHCLVATPGRLNDHLNKKRLNMDICKYFCLDEGDRMLDLGFDEEVHNIINRFKRSRQTILFSATMPQKFQDFAKTTLIKPLVVNVGRAGAANLDVIQGACFSSSLQAQCCVTYV